MKFKGLTGLVLGTLVLSGCDTPGDLVLKEIEIKGPVKVKLIQEVEEADKDNYRLEVYDEKDNLRATLKSVDILPNGTKLVYDDGKAYVVKNGNRFYEQEKILKAINKQKLILERKSDYKI